MHDETTREKGVRVFERVLGRPPNLEKPMRGVRELSYDHLFPEVWNREGLSLRERTLVTLAILAAGGHEGQLRAHVRGALSRGITDEEIVEVMVQVAHYAGWPAGMSGQVVAESVFEQAGASEASEASGVSRRAERSGGLPGGGSGEARSAEDDPDRP